MTKIAEGLERKRLDREETEELITGAVLEEFTMRISKIRRSTQAAMVFKQAISHARPPRAMIVVKQAMCYRRLY